MTSWAFGYDGMDYETARGHAADALQEFYDSAVANGNRVSQYLGPQINRSAGYITTYDLSQAPPRTPEETALVLSGTPATQGLPAEVACCLTAYSDRNIPRHRGRVFIGPLADGAIAAWVGGDLDVRPDPTFRETLRQAGARLSRYGSVTLAGEGTFAWSILSPTDEVARQVTHGWIDNAFDTQRRRGVQPTQRQLWNAGYMAPEDINWAQAQYHEFAVIPTPTLRDMLEQLLPWGW